ncbi:uncharacterized protein PG986_005586 [Apiospora aurea]|uniref:Uncharacterized protein n=1 Tax=Apiospora aurea TaxID=335848 RepID=A0ABR1QHY8_9PEZI
MHAILSASFITVAVPEREYVPITRSPRRNARGSRRGSARGIFVGDLMLAPGLVLDLLREPLLGELVELVVTVGVAEGPVVLP